MSSKISKLISGSIIAGAFMALGAGTVSAAPTDHRGDIVQVVESHTSQLPDKDQEFISKALESAGLKDGKSSPRTGKSQGKPKSGYQSPNRATWERIAQCESGGNWSINTGNGYYGGLQFDQQTWIGAGGGKYAPTANLATKEQQMEIADNVYATRGTSPWPTCG